MSYPFRKAAVAAVTAVAVATTSALVPAPAFADDGSQASLTRSADTSGQAEYDKLIAAVKKEVDDASKSIDKHREKAEKQKNEWGYDAAFEALNRLDEAELAIANINRILRDLPATPDDDALEDLKQARLMSFTLNQKISDAEYDIDLAEKVNKSETRVPFECKDAIDVGDTSGSSTGSSTTGIFNPLGNRIVYSKTGEPGCTTNLEFFSGRFIGAFTTLVTIASMIASVSKIVTAFTKAAQASKEKAEAGNAAAAAPAPAPAG